MQNKLFYIESAQSQNRNWFSYVVNDPVNYIDPFGLTSTDAGNGSSPKVTFSSDILSKSSVGFDSPEVVIGGFGKNQSANTSYNQSNQQGSINFTDTKSFVNYTMGTEFAVTVRDSKISSTKSNRGFSLPTGNIGIPANDTFQGGYNPKYNPFGESKATEIGRIGLESHELFHQYQYKTDESAFQELVREQIGYSFSSKNDPYIKGDPVGNRAILNKINSVYDIETKEGQAQFVGQWNADAYEYLSGENMTTNDIQRMKKEAMIILESGFKSQAASDILLLNSDRG